MQPMHSVSVSLPDIFQALSDPNRIRIVQLLMSSGRALCLCDFAEALSEPEYKLSRHLKLLRSGGLLSAEREGKWIYHSLVQDQKFLKYLLKCILSFPASSESSADLRRLHKRMQRSEGSRCQDESSKTGLTQLKSRGSK